MSSHHATNMSFETELAPDAFEAKYGTFRKNVLTAYRARHPLRLIDAAVSWVENRVAGSEFDAPIDRPIFVLGNFRSGTTFLEQVLAQHPSLGHFTYATSAFPRSPRFGDSMRRTIPGFMSAMSPPHQPNMVVDGASPFEAESIWRFCRNNLWTSSESNVLDSDFSDPPFEQLLRRTVQKQLHLQQRARFLHKNPPNTVRLGFLARVFPDARFIYLARHPLRMLRSQLDMVRSFHRVFPDADSLDYGEAFSNLFLPPARVFMRTRRHVEIGAAYARDPVLGVAKSLTDVHQEFERMVARGRLEDRVLTVRYEDLTKNFEQELPKILAFARLDDEAGQSLASRRTCPVDESLLSRRSPLPTFSPEVMEALRPLLERFDHRVE